MPCHKDMAQNAFARISSRLSIMDWSNEHDEAGYSVHNASPGLAFHRNEDPCYAGNSLNCIKPHNVFRLLTRLYQPEL